LKRILLVNEIGDGAEQIIFTILKICE